MPAGKIVKRRCAALVGNMREWNPGRLRNHHTDEVRGRAGAWCAIGRLGGISSRPGDALGDGLRAGRGSGGKGEVKPHEPADRGKVLHWIVVETVAVNVRQHRE